MSNNRDYLLETLGAKAAVEEKFYNLNVIAIEDEEQRFVACIQLPQSWLHGGEDDFIRISHPRGYSSIWQHKHYHDFNVFVLTAEEIAAMPRAVGDYSKDIEELIELRTWTWPDKDERTEERRAWDKQREQERVESQDADMDMGISTYDYWRMINGLNYDEREMEQRWKRYCDYRRKYGLKEEKIFPAFND